YCIVFILFVCVFTSVLFLHFLLSFCCIFIMFFFFFFFFFFNDTATTEIYTLSLHDALPIYYSRDPILLTPGPLTTSLATKTAMRSEEHTSELQSRSDLVCRLLLEKKKKKKKKKKRKIKKKILNKNIIYINQ